MTLLLDPNGAPVSTAQLAAEAAAEARATEVELPKFCPRCNEGSAKRNTHTGFGGHWKVVCHCGLLIAKGRGLPPIEGEGEEFDE